MCAAMPSLPRTPLSSVQRQFCFTFIFHCETYNLPILFSMGNLVKHYY